ncbi:MAG: endopeptidase La [Lachnospiraceae bacterium]|nr:endopeptidase La [Lachnospiraceae bacterium]
METRIIIPVDNAVLLPDVSYRLSISELNDSERARIKQDDSRVVLLQLRNEQWDRGNLKEEDFYPIGVSAEIMEIHENPLMGTFIQAETHEKVQLTNLTIGESVIEAEAEELPEISDITYAGEQQLLDRFKDVMIELSEHIKGGEQIAPYVKNMHSVNEFAAVFCQFYDLTRDQKYDLLKTDSLRERGTMVHDALMRFKGTMEMQIDLQKKDDPENRAYKKAAIKKQMTLLQDELDAMDPKEKEDEDSFENRIAASGMSDEVKKEVERVLRRFRQEPSNGAEYNSLYDYLDFVTTLKWQMEETPAIDLKKARKVMDRDHYGLDKVKDRILEHLAVMAMNERTKDVKQKGTILLLVGAPGTGKTSMGRSIAEALGRKYVRISLGGIRDEAEIRGHRRTYIGAMAGRIMSGIQRSGSMSPVMVLDEVDKIRSSYEGDPSAALLEVLDPEQNSTFTDHYVDLPYDLSHVFFICTANTWDTIPQPLLDRMEVIDLQGYTPTEHFHIAKEHLVPRAMEETGLSKKDIRFTDGALKKIISEYTSEAGVRGLEKQLAKVCRKAAVMLLTEEEDAAENKDTAETAKKKKIVVKESNLEEFLGRKKINHDKVRKENPAGVVTGLAWTQAGGEILFIESVAMKGAGHVRLTGQIGDVMKESAETAVSLVKSTFMSDNLDFRERDIHIHIPEGAVPKDGPSAGITMFTAVTSLVTGIPVSPYLAMTGEISLRGQVLPIGGLPEKLMAAERAGIRKVLIPKDNARDLEDIPEEITSKLEIVPVARVEEVIREALGIKLHAREVLPFETEKEEKSGKE